MAAHLWYSTDIGGNKHEYLAVWQKERRSEG